MLIGIISESTNEKDRWRRQTKKIKEVDSCGLPCGIIAMEIACRKKDFENNKISRKIETAAKRLIGKGAERLVLSRQLKCCEAKISDRISVGSAQLYRCFPDCVRVVSAKCGINLMKTEVCISADKMDRISEYLLRGLCYDTKRITMFTEDRMATESFCGRFYDETGLLVCISQDEKKRSNAEILIDVDENIVKIGSDIVVDDVGFEINVDKYSIDILDIMVCLKGFDWINEIKTYKDRKNRLTLYKN